MYSGRYDLADHWLRIRLQHLGAFTQGNHPWIAYDYVFLAQNYRMQGEYTKAREVLAQAPHIKAIVGEGGSNPNRYARELIWEMARIDLEQGKTSAAVKALEASSPGLGEFDEDRDDFAALYGEALCASQKPLLGVALLLRAIKSEERRGEEIPDSPRIARQRSIAGLCSLEVGDTRTAVSIAEFARHSFASQPNTSPYFWAPLRRLQALLGCSTTDVCS